MKWCIIGAGGIADRRTIPAILEDKSNEIVAIMDKVPAVAERLGEKYNVKYYIDEEQMLQENECDAVYIGTPVMCHYKQAMLALQFGCNVFIEKPIGLNAQEGENLVQAFKAAKKQIYVGYMMKYHNLHIKAKQLISENAIGEVTNVRAQFSCWYPEIAGAWRQNKLLGGGGAIMDLGVHCIELIEYILDDEIAEVKAFYGTKLFSYEVEDSGVVIFQTKKGILGNIEVNFNIPDKASESKLEIYGSQGYLIARGTLGQEECGDLAHLYSPQGEYEALQSRASDNPTVYSAQGENIYLKQIQDFCDNIRGGKLDYFYADRAVQVQKIVDTIYAQK